MLGLQGEVLRHCPQRRGTQGSSRAGAPRHTPRCAAPCPVPCPVPPGSPRGTHAAGRRGAAVPTGCWAGASAELRVSMQSGRFPQQRDGERGPIPTGWGSRPAAPAGLLLPALVRPQGMQGSQRHPRALWACREGCRGPGGKVGESSSPPPQGLRQCCVQGARASPACASAPWGPAASHSLCSRGGAQPWGRRG